jgi:uncharacterized protein YndB with AHSA1/START domain
MPSDREIVFTRVFNAPRQLVFDAWTKPEHVRHWYGCEKAVMTVCEIDLRPGGSYRFVLSVPDLPDFSISGVYREIVPPARIVCTERFNDDPNKEALIAVTFEERDGKTTMTSTALYRTPEDKKAVLDLGVEQGATTMFGRLDEYLKTLV